MEINTLRIIAMTMSLATFIGIVTWAWSASRKASFEQAETLPFSGDSDE
jgi:cytochrome c oxidase cbb3-type subunit IV